MKYRRSIEAMRKAGRVRATCTNSGQVRIAERYLNLAIEVCHEEEPPFHVTQAAFQDGMKGLRSAST